jgi:hypothetical protein
VRPIQSNLRLFYLNKKAHAFERSCCALSQEGAIGPFFEGDMPLNRIPVIVLLTAPLFVWATPTLRTRAIIKNWRQGAGIEPGTCISARKGAYFV